MYCRNCGAANADDANFCISCGNPLGGAAGNTANNTGTSAKNVFTGFADQVNRVAGLETPSEFKLSEIFSDVFKKHSDEEAESFFSVGTVKTTPPIGTVADSWPKPWIFARVLFSVVLIYLGFYVGLVNFGNANFLPGLIIVGAIATPFSLLIFFWEMNVPQNISIYRVVIVFIVGGITSLLFTVFLYSVAGDLSNVGSIVIGIVEEAGKVLAILLFVKNKRYPYVLNGLLIGAAVGAGFATFETAGYILNYALAGQDLFQVILVRAVLAPGGHIAWAALTGAAIYRIKGSGDFKFEMLGNMKFLRVFALVVVLHALWDSNFLPVISNDIPVYQIIYTLISWIVVFAFINTGLRQIAALKTPRTVES